MFAVGMPSSRPRRSPSTTTPSNRNGPPRKWPALSTSPAATSPRTWLELTISPSTSTSGTTRVSNSGREARNSASPACFLPKRKFSPTETCSAPSRSTSTSCTNCSGLFDAKSRSNGIVTSSSTPSPAIRSAFTPGGQSSFGSASGRTTASGCGSNVSTVSLSPITSRWPRCTPSKVPIATRRPGFGCASGRGVIFMGGASLGGEDHERLEHTVLGARDGHEASIVSEPHLRADRLPGNGHTVRSTRRLGGRKLDGGNEVQRVRKGHERLGILQPEGPDSRALELLAVRVAEVGHELPHVRAGRHLELEAHAVALSPELLEAMNGHGSWRPL